MSVPAGSEGPILLELDPEFWEGQLDRAHAFLGNVVLLQAQFRTMAEDALTKVGQPQFHAFLARVAANANRHEALIGEFHRLISRDPARHGRALAGSLAAKGRELLGSVEGLVGGVSGPWHDLRQLWLASQSAEGAYGVVEQLGYALGLKELAELAHKLVNEKHRDTLVIQEIVLEMAAVAVLYDGSAETSFGPRTDGAGDYLPDDNGNPEVERQSRPR